MTKKWIVGKFLPIALSVNVLMSGLAFSQAVSQISGLTKDQSGAAVPGVEVTAIQTDTGARRTAVTGDSGEFVIPNLLIGPYRLEAAKTGFRTYVQTGIELTVDSSSNIPITLGVGSVSETVQVEANAALVETRNLGVGTVMETQRILELPLNGRTPTDLIPFLGAAVQTGTSVPWSMQTGVTISVAGGASFGVYYGLDGAPHMNMYDSTNMPLPFPDALQEFKVETSAQDAQSGTHSGAQVNAVTKSGSNSFHGDLFEFFRNGDIGALLTRHGVPVIFDATANRRRYRDQARKKIPRFLEVYLDCPLETCVARDPKGIYRKARQGEANTVPGLQSAYEPPEKPELTVDSGRETPEAAARRVMVLLAENGYLQVD